jgi:hypothetical protein
MAPTKKLTTMRPAKKQQIPADTQATPPYWQAPWEFALHATVGTFIFGMIAAPALGAEVAISALQARGADWVIVLGLRGAAYAIFVTDLVLLGVFLWRTATRTIRKL